MSYAAALRDVRARVKKANTSFGAGMAVLPRKKREAMFALYAFCREVDDIADGLAAPEERQQQLEEWRARIRAVFQDRRAEGSITEALLVAAIRFPLVESDFQDIIDGMAMDAGEPICAPSRATLDLYCDRVAGAVGRASVRIFGDPGEKGLRVAHHLGRALQLTNILRDLSEDAARGRLYLPEELLAKYGIATRVPEEVLRQANLPLACLELANEALSDFSEADAAMRRCESRVMRPARIMRAYYGAILDRLIAANWRDPSARVRLPALKKAWLAIISFF